MNKVLFSLENDLLPELRSYIRQYESALRSDDTTGAVLVETRDILFDRANTLARAKLVVDIHDWDSFCESLSPDHLSALEELTIPAEDCRSLAEAASEGRIAVFLSEAAKNGEAVLHMAG